MVKLTESESFNLPWPNALPLVLLNLRCIPFGKYRLSSKIITRRPTCETGSDYANMSYEGDLLTYYKEFQRLLKFTQACRVVFPQSTPEDEDTEHYGLQPRYMIHQKGHLHKDSLQQGWITLGIVN